MSALIVETTPVSFSVLHGKAKWLHCSLAEVTLARLACGLAGKLASLNLTSITIDVV